ncbi:hypothetical protein [Conexibacter woesei]|uniref:Uncharacterized protein n=1 Tax=Conexibacter woesei (strain DSM 14684 / CCUG 47730 / CIP 108061 / JCM 11494 / NBRC 100937 / ID131577) TaxID=469383 RepID=D3EYX8_CONWI|nr:hypothetical protein [Conexibacter woesei]ADB49852.1 hypothetical protein Cwoe_1424 [Conexibacter woesei DSM 14684]
MTVRTPPRRHTAAHASRRSCAGSLAALALLLAACGSGSTPPATTTPATTTPAGESGETGKPSTRTLAHADRSQTRSFSLLRMRPDGLPAATRRILGTGRFGVNWALAKRIPVGLPGAYWLVPGAGYLCIVSQVPGIPGAGTACNETWRARREGLATISFERATGGEPQTRVLVGVTRDSAHHVLAHTGSSIVTVPVVDGIFVLRDAAAAAPDRLTVR